MVRNVYGNYVGNHKFITKENVDDLEQLFFNEEGELVPVPSEILREIPHNKLQFFCLKHGIYSVPSVEQIDLLKKLVGPPEEALEICSGNGVYGRNLGIRATDNYMQAEKNRAKFRNCLKAYEESEQAPVNYGRDVLEWDAVEAVRRFKPSVVLGSWATHKYNPCEGWRQGNMFGVNFQWILKRNSVKRLVLIGNHSVHKDNPIMDLPHQKIVDHNITFSRSVAKESNCIYIWDC